LYEPEFERVKRQPHRIYNVDETGICIVQHKSEKIVTLKGKKEVATIVASAERGKLITVIVCMNAAGMYVPPLIIWPRKNMKEELMDGAPPGSIWACHPSGWIQLDIFSMWFDHFIKHTAPTADNPVLLVLDGHTSNTRNILLLEKARENHVSIICLPPHSSHKMQPLDVGFMTPLKTYYASEIETFLRNVTQEDRDRRKDVVTAFRIARLFNAAYSRAATMEIAINSYKKTGLYPCNKNIFEDYDFPVPADDTSQPIAACDNQPTLNQPDSDAACSSTPSQSNPGPSWVLPTDISPIPCLRPSTSKHKGSAAVLTSSPYKRMLCKKVQKEKNKKWRPEDKAKNVRRRLLTTKGKKQKKANLEEEAESCDSDSIQYDDRSDDNAEDSFDDYDCDEDDAVCILCGGTYKNDTHGEEWVQCIVCHRWAHVECGIVEEIFTCAVCKRKLRKK